MSYNFNLPSITGKNADEKIQQLLSYIYKLVGDLNYFANQNADTPKGGNTIVGNDADSTSLAMIQRTVRDLQSALNKVKVDIENLPDVPSEVEYLVGVTKNIQTQIDAVNEAIAGIEIPTLPTLDYLPLSGGVLTGKTSIDRTAENKTEPIDQDLAINYYLPNGSALTERNAPGIGFHIKNIDWASLIFDGTFKFVNAYFTAFAPVQASNFIGRLIGNADTATKATQDGNGNNIAEQFNALKGTVLYEVDPRTTNGIYANGKETADSINSVTLSDSSKKFKRLKIYARFPSATQISEFDLAMPSSSTNALFGNKTGSIFTFSCDCADANAEGGVNGANRHYFLKINFCVRETASGWTFQITDAGYLIPGIPVLTPDQFHNGGDLSINGTSYGSYQQRHNSNYCIYKIIGYEE
jgi:hypothetical protein